ncbi:class I SAM-dependent methyltransferase [Halochromatium roseum]|uniref:class I SAM-dependent methyltransferase n=1 Tax=Halochromatium roseum TaxID=391920 RepID=UPI001911D410|nr:class I SAM-dependent methyltransferase [Halochromatium roseum]MBK5941810.1 hypothetical protein [Halochromatium roseum]
MIYDNKENLMTSEFLDRGLPPYFWARNLPDNDWAQALVNGYGPSGETLPQLPDEPVQRKFVGGIGFESMQRAMRFVRRLKNSSSQHIGRDIGSLRNILDVGVGFGRIYRILMRDLHPRHLLGVDVDPAAIELTRSAMPYCNVELLAGTPPYSNLAEDQFELAYLHSVFSHLSEAAFLRLLVELKRVLTKSAILVFTTLKTEHVDRWDAQRNLQFMGAALAKVEFDAIAWRRLAQGDSFLYVPTGGGDPSRPHSEYGEAIVSKGYLVKTVPDLGFELLEYDSSPGLPQAYCVLGKK